MNYKEWINMNLKQGNFTTIPEELTITVTDCTDPFTFIFENEKLYDGRKLNYGKIIDAFIETNNCVYCNGHFYTPDGYVSNDIIKRWIYESLRDLEYDKGLDKPVNSIFTSLIHACAVDELPVNNAIIPCANGDLHIYKNKPWEYRLGERKQCAYRLDAKYTDSYSETPLFNKWLHDTFTDEDIPTIQEILGYCLVPITKAQEAFIIVGDAGTGKSGTGVILKSLLGNAFTSVDTQSLVSERFQIASVENKLVAYDDDMGTAALSETGLLKKLITADSPIKAERKYIQSYEFKSFCKVVACTNFMLSSLYDDSEGFYRRLHPIWVKPLDPNRKTLRGFYNTMVKNERDQIFRWALQGLWRLINNDFQITWSARSLEYAQKNKFNSSSYATFLEDTIKEDVDGEITTKEFISLYKRWCKENGIQPNSERRVAKWLSNDSGFTSSKHIKRGDKDLRGYKGVSIKSEWAI